MRRRRKFDAMLMTTALVLVAAVFVAFSIRLIKRSNESDHGIEFVPADDLLLTRPATSGSVDGATPAVFPRGDDIGVSGLIDRHFIDMGAEKQISADDTDVPQEVTSAASPTTTPATTTSTTTPRTTTTRDPKAFESVDIRYYVKSEAGLNMREEPSKNAKIMQKLDYGTSLRVIGLNDEWARVRLPGMVVGYVSRDFITLYKPATESTATSPPSTTKTTNPTKTTKTTKTTGSTATTANSTVKPPEGAPRFNNPPAGGSNTVARANLQIIKQYGLINKEGSPSINRHYETFTDNGDGTITVDGITMAYSQKMDGRRATHYDGVAVCRHSIQLNGGKCFAGHTTPTCHGTASGLLAQRGIVAVSKADSALYPRGAVVFVVGYGMAVVGDRSGTHFDLCYDADECKDLSRSNWTNGIYLITTSP